jgi:hypothetical protein
VACISDEAKKNSQGVGEVSITCLSFLTFVKTKCPNLHGDGQGLESILILGRSLLLGQTVGWKRITDWLVMVGRESERGIASNIIQDTDFIDGQQTVE